MKRIVHLIPYDSIGGVEVAARSLPTGRHGNLNFKRQYLVQVSETSGDDGEYHGPKISQNNPWAYWKAVLRLYRNPPDLLVASLWRSALILIVLKMLRPHAKVVILLHSANDTHLFDKVSNRLAMYLSNAIWTDSSITLQKRVPRQLQSKSSKLSFLLKPRSLPEQRDPAPKFIFWGRLNKHKGLDRALELFSHIVRARSDAQFTIIGPDGGLESQLRTKVFDLGLSDCVVFKGPLHHEEIAEQALLASFYIQTSLVEGMAMAVVEAMQAGLVPVVTPIGEIANYCDDGENAVFVHDDGAAVETILGLLSDADRYRQMSYCAADYWQASSLYRNDFLGAAKKVIDGEAGDA
jgi:glycosyltransferase involved in cell wall biosynthesis